MKVHRISKVTLLQTDIKTAWNFFASPANLNQITPAELSFEIISDIKNVRMYRGQEIHYKIRPFRWLTFRWHTIIEECDEEKSFTDVQQSGPYAMWCHQHIFEKTIDGIVMRDEISYSMKYGFLGELIHQLVIRKKLERIFAYREKTIPEVIQFNRATF